MWVLVVLGGTDRQNLTKNVLFENKAKTLFSQTKEQKYQAKVKMFLKFLTQTSLYLTKIYVYYFPNNIENFIILALFSSARFLLLSNSVRFSGKKIKKKMENNKKRCKIRLSFSGLLLSLSRFPYWQWVYKKVKRSPGNEVVMFYDDTNVSLG